LRTELVRHSIRIARDDGVAGVAINVLLGYFLSPAVFRDYWMAVP